MKKIYGVFLGIAVLSLFQGADLAKAEYLPIQNSIGIVGGDVVPSMVDGTYELILSDGYVVFDIEKKELNEVVEKYLLDKDYFFNNKEGEVLTSSIFVNDSLIESIEMGEVIITKDIDGFSEIIAIFDELGNQKYPVPETIKVDSLDEVSYIEEEVSKQLRPNYVSDRFRAVVGSIFSIFR